MADKILNKVEFEKYLGCVVLNNKRFKIGLGGCVVFQ
jgi:hypothetical protein